MKPSDFVKACVMREAKDIQPIKDRLQATENVRLLHAMIGMVTEAGEIQDQMKKAIFYGKQVDKVNLVEELGDVMWYVAIAADTLGVSLEEIMERNNAKLEARYGKVFTETAALNRDLDKEREILEKK
jgi:NTP pyrophosphatase (non-canonical NTP hydrolase)